MRRIASALTIILALYSAVAGGFSFNQAAANPAPLFSFPFNPVTTLPTIVVPFQNQTYISPEILLSFSIVKPESWFSFNDARRENGQPITRTFVNITSIYYVVDNGGRRKIPFHDIDSLFDTVPTLILNFSTALPMTAGTHTVKVGLEATSYYWLGGYDWSESHGSVELHSDSETVNFTKALFIEVLLPANKTFDTSSIPLKFTIDEPVSQMTYSLDGKENVAVPGNATLTGLSNGEHNVTVYATDEAGNLGSSKNIVFTIAKPEPLPHLLVVAVSVAVAIVVAMASSVYWKKRK
jgi:hypothetical protein